MNPKDFCEWLQAFIDSVHPNTLDADQLAVVRDHLRQVFHAEDTP